MVRQTPGNAKVAEPATQEVLALFQNKMAADATLKKFTRR